MSLCGKPLTPGLLGAGIAKEGKEQDKKQGRKKVSVVDKVAQPV